MNRTALLALRSPLAVALAAALFVGCDETTPVSTEADATLEAQFAQGPPEAEIRNVVKKLRKATDRYHNLNNALADGFVKVHDCEVRPGEGPVGTVYALPGRFDAVLDLSQPEALVYEPRSNGRPRLVAAELVIPYSAWTNPQPPEFLGHTFQREDEFGVFGLHVWVWRSNPNGLFAEANPRISCDTPA